MKTFRYIFSRVFAIATFIFAVLSFSACNGKVDQDLIDSITGKVSVEKITIDQEDFEMTEGESTVLTATVLPADATDKTISWNSSKEDVVMISNTGKAMAMAPGKSVITAKAGNKTDFITIAVIANAVPVTGISLDKTSLTLAVGESETLTATITPEDATNKNVSWTSSDPLVATVENGRITGVKPGSVTITAKTEDGDKTAECAVTVKTNLAPSVTIGAEHISAVSAVLKGKANVSDPFGLVVGIQYYMKKGNLPSDPISVEAKDSDEEYYYSIEVTGLEPDSTYFFRSFFKKDGQEAYGETMSFKTKDLSSLLKTEDVSDVTYTGAVLHGNLDLTDVLYSGFEYGFYWDSTEASQNSHSESNDYADNAFSASLSGLNPGTQYWYKAYVKLYDENEKEYEYIAPVRTINTHSYISKISLTGSNLSVGRAATFETSVTPSDAYDKSLLWTSSDESVATVDQAGKVTGVSAGTTTITATAKDGSGQSASAMVTVFDSMADVVDLGLSVKWASCNLCESGFVSSPEVYGDYYAWGETLPKSDYSWSSYKWCNGSSTSLTKYNTSSSYGSTVDNKTMLESGDDAAQVKLGGNWRMPADEEFAELRNSSNCSWEWMRLNGVTGYKVTSIKSGYTGNWIFLPAAGRRYDARLLNVGSYGYYWSSSLTTDYPYYAYRVYFYSGDVSRYYYYRYYGLSVRPVLSSRSVVNVSLDRSYLVLESRKSDVLTATVLPSDAHDKSLTWTSSDESVATVDQTGKVTAVSCGTATITATANSDSSVSASCSVYVIQSSGVVDLGLSVKWAASNLSESGFVSSPEMYGDYYAWGETEPYYEAGYAQSKSPVWKSQKTTGYNWASYKWCNGSYNGLYNSLTKYNTRSSHGSSVDNKTVLEADDDVAHVKLGGSWRMPTDAEWTELRNTSNCTWTCITLNGIYGRLVTSKKNGANIFLPAAGFRSVSDLDNVGSGGYYWSSSLTTDNPGRAYYVYFNSDNVLRYYILRCYGLSVRPVSE